jgi:catechol 2,3-dioxygenase-like lactoylglutathione lyase family enzyme
LNAAGAGKSLSKKGIYMIKAAEHFSFTVSSMEIALHFFQDLLGLKASPIMEVENPKVQKIVGMPNAHLRISIVDIPNSPNIELIEYVRPNGQKIDSTSCNAGAAHIAFLVEDIQKMHQELTEKGIRFIHPPVWAPGNDGTGRWGVAYLKGPDDITIELVEKQP